MACTIVSTPATGAADWTGWITQQGLTDRGFMQVSLTNFAASAASSVAAGSIMELAGSIYSFTETAISLATGTPSANTAVYYTVIPAAGGTTCTVVMDDTAPTWVDGKQGYYASAASTTRYMGGAYLASITSFSGKWLYEGQAANISRVRVTKNDAQAINNMTNTIIQYDDEELDNLGEFASNRFTANATGYYSITASMACAIATFENGEYWQITLLKDGASYAQGSRDGSEASVNQSRISNVATLVYLVATQYIEVRVYHNQGGTVNTSTNAQDNYFTVHGLS